MTQDEPHDEGGDQAPACAPGSTRRSLADGLERLLQAADDICLGVDQLAAKGDGHGAEGGDERWKLGVGNQDSIEQAKRGTGRDAGDYR